MANIRVESYAGGLNVVVYNLDTSYENDRYFVWQAKLGSTMVVDETTTEDPYISSTSFYMDGLTPGRTYSITVGVYTTSWSQLAVFRSSGVPDYYTISATVIFNANGGSVSPSRYTGYDESSTEYGYVDIVFPTPTWQGHRFDYWQIVGQQTQFQPGTHSIFGSYYGETWTAKAYWSIAPTSNVYINDNGQWKTATAYIYDGGWQEADANIYDGGWQ